MDDGWCITRHLERHVSAHRKPEQKHFGGMRQLLADGIKTATAAQTAADDIVDGGGR
jgi:hypothetical protein